MCVGTEKCSAHICSISISSSVLQLSLWLSAADLISTSVTGCYTSDGGDALNNLIRCVHEFCVVFRCRIDEYDRSFFCSFMFSEAVSFSDPTASKLKNSFIHAEEMNESCVSRWRCVELRASQLFTLQLWSTGSSYSAKLLHTFYVIFFHNNTKMD